PGFELGETVTPSPHHPIGAKGVGESATVGSPAAFVNAVIDALAHAGVRNIDMPLTSDKVWEALNRWTSRSERPRRSRPPGGRGDAVRPRDRGRRGASVLGARRRPGAADRGGRAARLGRRGVHRAGGRAAGAGGPRRRERPAGADRERLRLRGGGRPADRAAGSRAAAGGRGGRARGAHAPGARRRAGLANDAGGGESRCSRDRVDGAKRRGGSRVGARIRRRVHRTGGEREAGCGGYRRGYGGGGGGGGAWPRGR